MHFFYPYTHWLYHSIKSGTTSILTFTCYTTPSTEALLLFLHSPVITLYQLWRLFYLYIHQLYQSINSGTSSIQILTGYNTLSTQAPFPSLHSPVIPIYQPSKHFYLSSFLLYKSPPYTHIISAFTSIYKYH